MYIQCSTVKRKGKDGRNRKLVEAYRDPKTGQPRNRTVQKLESLPILERARLIFKYGGQKHLDPHEWKALIDAGDFAQTDSPICIGDSYRGAGNWVLLQYLQHTGLQSILKKHLGRKAGGLICDMLTLQILAPDSKLGYVQKRQHTLNYVLDGKKPYKEDSLYLALDVLDEQFQGIREALNARHPYSGRLLLYDLSNSYFCGSKAELGGYGQSKEKRHDRYIVSYGLVCTQQGRPLDIRVWKGGTADAKTVAQTFADWKQAYQANSAIWVADRSMSDEKTLADVHRLGLSYITGLPPSTQIALLESIHEASPDLFDQPLSEFTQDGQRYILCRHHQKGYRRQRQNHRNLRKAYQGLKKIQASPQNYNQQKLYHRAIKVLETHRQTKFWELSFQAYPGKKGKERYRLSFRLDRRRFQAQNIIGHYYLLQTNLSRVAADPEQIQQYYKSLMMVERCFRMAKTSLEIRPIRHWKKRRIIGHIYLNYLCLWLIKYIENQWRARGNTKEVVSTLRRWDQALRYTELLDKDQQTPVGYEWTRGEQARQSIQEIRDLGVQDKIQPKL